MTMPIVKGKALIKFPANVVAEDFLSIAKANGVYTFSVDFTQLSKVASVPNPSTTFTLVWDSSDDLFALVAVGDLPSVKTERTLTAAGPYAALPSDDILIVKQTVGAAFNITVDWSRRTHDLTIVDGKGDAATNNITITPATGQTQYAVANQVVTIDGNGGSVTLRRLSNGTGAY